MKNASQFLNPHRGGPRMFDSTDDGSIHQIAAGLEPGGNASADSVRR